MRDDLMLQQFGPYYLKGYADASESVEKAGEWVEQCKLVSQMAAAVTDVSMFSTPQEEEIDSGLPDILDISAKWIFDSGASAHICSATNAHWCRKFVKRCAQQKFRSANGAVIVDSVLQGQMKAFGNQVVDIILMPDTPALLSMGECEAQGYTSIWAHGYMPCVCCNKTGAVTPLDLISNVPYLMRGGIGEIANDTATIEQLTGVVVHDGHFHLQRLCYDQSELDGRGAVAHHIRKDFSENPCLKPCEPLANRRVCAQWSTPTALKYLA